MGMDITGIGSIFDFGSKVIDKIFPDPAQRDAAKLEMLRQQQAGAFKEMETELAMAQGQMQTNQTEASNANVFVSGWRPFIGWVCGAALVYHYILRPMLPWLLALLGKPMPPIPPLDMGDLITILLGMLGLGGLRTYEKKQGVA